jgi:hypothetical protein
MNGTKYQQCSSFVLDLEVLKTIHYFELIWLVESPFSATFSQHGSSVFIECLWPTNITLHNPTSKRRSHNMCHEITPDFTRTTLTHPRPRPIHIRCACPPLEKWHCQDMPKASCPPQPRTACPTATWSIHHISIPSYISTALPLLTITHSLPPSLPPIIAYQVRMHPITTHSPSLALNGWTQPHTSNGCLLAFTPLVSLHQPAGLPTPRLLVFTNLVLFHAIAGIW